MATAVQLSKLADETDSAMNEIQQSIEQADKMLITLEEQGLGDSPTAAKIRTLVDSMRDQRKKLMANMSVGSRKVTFADHLADKAESGDPMAMQASLALKRKEKMENGLLPNILSDYPQSSTSKAKSAKPIIKLNHPKPLSDSGSGSETDPQLSDRPLTTGPRDLSHLTSLKMPCHVADDDANQNLFGMLSSFVDSSNDEALSAVASTNPEKRLKQLDDLETQLSGIKDVIASARNKATKDLEKQKAACAVDLSNNVSFLNLSHAVENLKILQNTQYDRLKDVVSILNNHADRLISIEDSISDIRNDFKRTSLNSMSEKLLENMLKVHTGRPHFILELFEVASKLNSDEKRQIAIQTLKNLEMYTPTKKLTSTGNQITTGKGPELKSLTGPVPASKEAAKVVPSLSSLAENAVNSEKLDQEKTLPNGSQKIIEKTAKETEKIACSVVDILNCSSQNQAPELINDDDDDDEEAIAKKRADLKDTISHILSSQLPSSIAGSIGGDNDDGGNDDDDDDDSSEESDTETDHQHTSSNAEFSDIHTNEVNDNRRIDEQKSDMVSRMLGAAQLGVNVNDVQDEVKKLVTDLLPTLTRNYRNKYLTYDVIDEAKAEIADHILNNSSAFNSDTNKVILYQAIEKCLVKYKDGSVTENSTEILMDIGTSILKAMLHAKSQGNRE